MPFQQEFQAASFALDAKDRNKALRHALNALEQTFDDQERAKCHVLMADTHRLSGDLLMATLSLRRAIDCDSSNPETHHYLGNIFQMQGNFTSARRELEQAVELSPETAEYHCSLANSLSGLEDSANAIIHYKTAIDLQSDYMKVYIDFGQFLSKLERYDEAIDILRQALKVSNTCDPEHVSALRQLAGVYRKSGLESEAIEAFARAQILESEHIAGLSP